MSIVSALMLLACASESMGQPKDWTVTWQDNSDNESEFVLYQFDTTLPTPDWIVVGIFAPDIETAIVSVDISKGDRFGISARNPAGESGKATHTVDPKYIRIPAMPGFINLIPTL